MKKALYIILTLIAMVQFYSCQKLDVAPVNKFTEANYWVSTDKAKLVLNMAYNQMYSACDFDAG